MSLSATLAFVAKKYREVRRALREAGWRRVRQAGSHEVWESRDRNRKVVVAGRNSATVPAGTLAAIRRETGDGRLSMTDYLVIYEQAEDGGWGAHSPDLGGVFAFGATRAETERLMEEAVAAYVAELRGSGKPIPEPRTVAGRVAA